MHRIDHELPALFIHKRVNPIDEHVIPEDGQYVVPEFSFLFWEERNEEVAEAVMVALSK